jgi:hypothetical protein
MAETHYSSGGIGFFTALGLIFITLKLVGVINWSWWVVTLPLWGGLALILLIALLYFIFLIIAAAIKPKKRLR